jgi:hypothetical protein
VKETGNMLARRSEYVGEHEENTGPIDAPMRTSFRVEFWTLSVFSRNFLEFSKPSQTLIRDHVRGKI